MSTDDAVLHWTTLSKERKGAYDVTTERASVPGGYMYRTLMYQYGASTITPAVTMVFTPRPGSR